MTKKLVDFLDGIDNAEEVAAIIEKNLKNEKCKVFIDDGEKNIYIPKSRLDGKIAELRTANDTIEKLEGTIDELKDPANNKTITDLKDRIKGYQNDIKQMRIDNAVQLIAAETKAKDAKDLAKFLDMEKIVLSESGEVSGLKEQMEVLQKDKPYLFEEAQPQPQQNTGWFNGFLGTGDPGRPGASISNSKTFHEGDFGKMLGTQATQQKTEKVIDSEYYFK